MEIRDLCWRYKQEQETDSNKQQTQVKRVEAEIRTSKHVKIKRYGHQTISSTSRRHLPLECYSNILFLSSAFENLKYLLNSDEGKYSE